MSPLLTEGDIRAPEVWLRVDIHDRRALPSACPNPCQVRDGLLAVPGDVLEPFPEAARHTHPWVATLKAPPPL